MFFSSLARTGLCFTLERILHDRGPIHARCFILPTTSAYIGRVVALVLLASTSFAVSKAIEIPLMRPFGSHPSLELSLILPKLGLSRGMWLADAYGPPRC
jgi:hypothetical protein